MSASYLESLKIVEHAFRFYPPHLVEIMLEVRSIALGIKPEATEQLRRSGITLFDPEKGGTITGGICFIDLLEDRVRIRFGRGVVLDDPHGLLRGNQKFMRHIDLVTFDGTPWDAIESLLRESAHLDERRVKHWCATRLL